VRQHDHGHRRRPGSGESRCHLLVRRRQQFYVFELAPNGKASVWRRQRGRWLKQVDWQDAKGANQGDGAINELRVTTIGGQANFYVNDEPFKDLTGSPPDNGQEIGVFAASPDAGAATYSFDNLKVTKP